MNLKRRSFCHPRSAEVFAAVGVKTALKFRDYVTKTTTKRLKVPSLTSVEVKPERFSAHLCNEIMMSHCITVKPTDRVDRELWQC